MDGSWKCVALVCFTSACSSEPPERVGVAAGEREAGAATGVLTLDDVQTHAGERDAGRPTSAVEASTDASTRDPSDETSSDAASETESELASSETESELASNEPESEPVAPTETSMAEPDAGPSALIPCEERYPDYDCDLSRSAWSNTVSLGACITCHGPEGGALPGFALEPHDAALPYVYPGDAAVGDVTVAPLVQLIRDGHHCDAKCDETADQLVGSLHAWETAKNQRPQRIAQLDAAEQLWLSQDITDYEWRIGNFCFNCDEDYANNALVVVRGGRVTKLFGGDVHDDEEPSTALSVDGAMAMHTVPGLFELLRDAVEGDPDWIDLTFDPILGFPTSADIDYKSDWFDEEDYYASHYLLDLSVGYCADSAPFRITEAPEQLCESTSDCAECQPPHVRPAGCIWPYRACESDADCPEAARCVEKQPLDCPIVSTECRALCSTEPCEAGFQCGEDEKCSPISCTEDAALCLEGERCQPDLPNANPHGCTPPNCVDDAVDCGPIAECSPEDPQVLANGCAPLPCEASADCACGSCVNERCAIAPGSCGADSAAQ